MPRSQSSGSVAWDCRWRSTLRRRGFAVNGVESQPTRLQQLPPGMTISAAHSTLSRESSIVILMLVDAEAIESLLFADGVSHTH